MMITDEKKEQLYHDYYGKVHGYIRSKINSAQDAEDIAADVFLKVYEKLDRFDENKASLNMDLHHHTQHTDRLFPNEKSVRRNT